VGAFEQKGISRRRGRIQITMETPSAFIFSSTLFARYYRALPAFRYDYLLSFLVHRRDNILRYIIACNSIIVVADLLSGAQYDLRVLARTKQGWPNISEAQLDWATVTMPSSESNQFTIRNMVDIQILIVNASIVKVRVYRTQDTRYDLNYLTRKRIFLTN